MPASSDKAAPQLSKHSASFMRARQAKKSSAATVAHKYDASQFHQNANRQGIRSLTQFDCPVCQCKNTIRVELCTKTRMATVKCSYCMSLRPKPEDLPYPHQCAYVPKLENKADAFFRFSEKYRRIVETAGMSPKPMAMGSSGEGQRGTLQSDDLLDALLEEFDGAEEDPDAEEANADADDPKQANDEDDEGDDMEDAHDFFSS